MRAKNFENQELRRQLREVPMPAVGWEDSIVAAARQAQQQRPALSATAGQSRRLSIRAAFDKQLAGFRERLLLANRGYLAAGFAAMFLTLVIFSQPISSVVNPAIAANAEADLLYLEELVGIAAYDPIVTALYNEVQELEAVEGLWTASLLID